MRLCSVCQSTGAEFHFGGYCCRACAAFFRRYVHSKKRSIRCVCGTQPDTSSRSSSEPKSSHQCRHCRMTRCLEAGLQKSKVQPLREPNAQKPIKTESLSSQMQIVSREFSKIRETALKWESNTAKRKCLYGENAEYLNFYQISCLTKEDTALMWQMVQDLFPSLKTLRAADKESLISNFMSKFFLMESSHEVMTWYRSPREYAQWNEENRLLLYNFYNGSMPEKSKMGMNEVVQIFWPFWTYYYEKIMIPIYDKRSDMMESIAQLLLVLFDPAYINISEDCSNLCRQLRNLILRELKGYLIDKNQSEHRFFDMLENLSILENADEKFREELIICDLYNVKLHEDFRRIFMTEKI